MKKIIKLIRLAGVLFLIFSITSCYYDEIVPKELPPITDDISFNDDIIPIFNGSCNLTGCHSSGGVRPDLTPNNAFNSLISGGYTNTNDPPSSVLYLWVSGQERVPMPPSGADPKISATILAWIDQGALNN
jgi:hypothetical protein